MNRHRHRRITQTALAAIAALSLLGASVTGAAAKPTIGTKKLKDNAVTTKKIKNGEVKTKDIGDGQIQMVDLSAALQAQLQPALELLDGSVTTPEARQRRRHDAQARRQRRGLGAGRSEQPPG